MMNSKKGAGNSKANPKSSSPAPKKRAAPKEPVQTQNLGNNNYNMMQSPGMDPMMSPMHNPNAYQSDFDPNPMMTYDIPEMRLPNFIDNSDGGESVKVAVRIRPMNQQELARGDECCVKTLSDKGLQMYNKGTVKQFAFNATLDERTNQSEVSYLVNINQLLEASLDGYSTTLFAYGQTGSGKTYSMSGVEEKLSKDVYVPDESEGIIPRAFRNMWQMMIQRDEQFYVKASFMEIYNEQVRDILNPSSGILHTRWNIKNGFFVEDLMVVECRNVEDLLAVLHEGMKNRKKGSHQLNQDSSRSHSILTVYLISEVVQDDQTLKKYGKISFVDLAGSERLSQSKSHERGDTMVKETGNINRSLFALGKVISGLSDKKNKTPYIPYRDSKLTMLLMDSLGGTSKCLMIACVSPSAVYFEETLSTLNYATRTMNIKNKPVVQMDPKEQIIFNLTRENELLRMENQYLREQLQRAAQGLPIEVPDFLPQPGQKNTQLPPLSSSKRSGGNQRMTPQTKENDYSMELPVNKVINEYQIEITRLQQENEELRGARDVAEKNYHLLMNENNALNIKLENLENVFIGNPIQKGVESEQSAKKKMGDEFMIANLMTENTELKNQLSKLEEKNMELGMIIKEKGLTNDPVHIMKSLDIGEVSTLRQNNTQLQNRVEFLQRRERELIDQVDKAKRKTNRPPSDNDY